MSSVFLVKRLVNFLLLYILKSERFKCASCLHLHHASVAALLKPATFICIRQTHFFFCIYLPMFLKTEFGESVCILYVKVDIWYLV
uniref:Putative secreted protein n=1 Tax=Rhipicephalus microplus TaxID=6941 RepID=A0A6G5A4D7_RHIMP